MPFKTSPDPDFPPPTSTTSTHPSSSNPSDQTKPIYFWRPTQGNGYLSQWYYSPFTVDGETYSTAEMWMMVQKARLFGDEDTAKRMLGTTDPKEHKSLGREVQGFVEGAWDEHKVKIVEQGNYHKFTISDDADSLRAMLLATGKRELVEASPSDRIWGIGFVEERAEGNRRRWGDNLLGLALTSVRKRLVEEGKGE